MKSDTDIILERSRHAASAAQWLRNSVRLEVMTMRRMRDAGAPGAIPSERICTLWREYRLATKLAKMNARHAAKMAAVQRDIDIMKGVVQ
jgi:hypothetical protein